MPDETTGDTGDMLDMIVQQLLGKQTGGNALTDVGQVLGNAAAGRASGVNAANTTALAGGALGNNLFQSAMQRALAQAALPNFRAQQAVTGDQIANTQDVVPTGPANVMAHVVNFTGGRRPSNLGPNARSAGAALSGIGASNIGKDVLPAVPSMPKLSDGGGALGNALGGGSLLSSLLGALGGGGKGGSGFDIGKLLSGLKGGYHTTVTGDQGPDIGGIDVGEQYGLQTDPSGGTGAGPGLEGLNFDDLNNIDWSKILPDETGGGGMGDRGPDDEWWHP